MRLYKKIKSLGTGVTASQKNKGILLINPTGTTGVVFSVNIINVDNTVTTLNLTIGRLGAFAGTQASDPNYALIPFRISSWTDTDTNGIIGYELF
jgi:hypothetical protein